MKHFTIAIDGPVGAGKSSVADGVAARLGVLHLDTGAMYRAFAWKALKEGISTQDEAALTALAERARIEVRFEQGAQRTLADGADVTEEIRTPEISMAASNVSRFGAVRARMVRLQQELALGQSIVLDGRDIGAKVLPDATLKIFLTASPEVRARRRLDEMLRKGQQASFDDVLADVERRDRQDATRAIDPLRPARDAQVLDCSALTQEQVTAEIVERLEQKL
ncbi:MAG: (d)CMP kinase [Eubacteriales bacterium]|nr:(d)CMP kinase [Eubacteriales bacterium]